MSIKEQIHRLVDTLPDDKSAVEELHCRLYVLEKNQRGLNELNAGKGLEDAAARQELAKWLTD